MHADPEVMHDYGGPISRSESDAKLDGYVAAYREHGFSRWAVETHAGDFLGYAGIMTSGPDHPLGLHVQIGWRLMRHAWGLAYLISMIGDIESGNLPRARDIALQIAQEAADPMNLPHLALLVDEEKAIEAKSVEQIVHAIDVLRGCETTQAHGRAILVSRIAIIFGKGPIPSRCAHAGPIVSAARGAFWRIFIRQG